MNKSLFTATIRSTGNAGSCGYMSSMDYRPLYNGNISSMAVNIGKLNQPLLYNYQYDQLNRIISMDAFNGLNQTSNDWTALSKINDYQERISYDANGNVQTGLRNGSSTQLALENFQYNYDATDKNKLLNIQNTVNSGNYNYSYDAIGETTKDDLAGNASMDWNVYGKLTKVVKADGTEIDFTYDAAGNRISKTVSGTNGYTEWYVNDASGNIMAVYKNLNGNDTLNLSEQDIYGSSRLAVFYRGIDADAALPAGTDAKLIGKYYVSFYKRGSKNYYFGNHLGNTLLITSDKKVPHSSDGTTVDYYSTDVVSVADYSTFGVNLMDRTINSTNILYGFNGKWNDFETGYENYGMRMYSGGDRRFKSVDPMTKKYPELTPYQFASNRPIDGIDLDGLEYLRFQTSMYRMQAKTVVIKYENIPWQIQNPQTHSFSYVSGGPVTGYGRDYDSNLDGPAYIDIDRYYRRAEFYNLPTKAEPEPTPSAKGNVIPGSHGTQERAENLGAGASALGESGAGFAANLWNYLSPLSTQAGISEEERLRKGFYNSTNAVSQVVDRKSGIINTVQGPRPVNSDALINFVTDGILKYDKNSKQSVIETLQTAYYGVQILRNENVQIRKETRQAISDLIKQYKSNGGSNDFDNISDYYKPQIKKDK